MNAKEYYEHIHGTGEDSDNLNKSAVILLMEQYRIHCEYGDKGTADNTQTYFHMASNNHSPVSTGESY